MSNDPAWLRQCQEKIARLSPPLMCDPYTCEDAAWLLDPTCACEGIFPNGCAPAPTPGCCAYTASSPVFVGRPHGGCYCCCGEPKWPGECADAVSRLGGALCADATCELATVQAYLRAFCTCTPPHRESCSSPPGRCDCRERSPAFVNGVNCYCCCGSVLAATVTAVDGVRGKDVEAFAEGDPVYVAEDASLARWTQRPVAFSASAAATGIEVPVVRIRFRTGAEAVDWVVADRNRPFLLADRTLRRAGELGEGDALVREDGAPAPVVEVAPVAPRAVHQLATTREPARAAGGHLLLVHGVVAGDYALQLADLDAVAGTAAES